MTGPAVPPPAGVGAVPYAGAPSGAWPVQAAVVAALLAAFAAAPPAARLAPGPDGLPGVYDAGAFGGAPPPAGLPYVTIGDASEGAAGSAGHYGRPGREGVLTLHLWARDRAGAALVHGVAALALERRPLAVGDGWATVRGGLALVTDLTDPDGTHHRVLRYTYAVRRAAPDTPPSGGTT